MQGLNKNKYQFALLVLVTLVSRLTLAIFFLYFQSCLTVGYSIPIYEKAFQFFAETKSVRLNDNLFFRPIYNEFENH